MSRGLWVWTAAACVHLALSVCGATEIVPARSLSATVQSQYGFLTGADAGFSFFAPSVASLARVTFTLRDADGRTWSDTIFGDTHTAWGLRSSAVFDSLAEMEERIIRGVTGSWAALLFGRNPQATEIVVAVEVEGLPTMEAWRAGERSHWIPVYRATFERGATAAAAGHDG